MTTLFQLIPVYDPSLFVPKRFGAGWTVNLARPPAWLLVAATLALVALGPIIARFTG